jgi:hypothetical protein
VWFVLIKWLCGDGIDVDQMGGVCGTNGENRIAYIILIGRLEYKGPI